jgi:hypothetical protein
MGFSRLGFGYKFVVYYRNYGACDVRGRNGAFCIILEETVMMESRRAVCKLVE